MIPIYLRNRFLAECCLTLIVLGSVSCPFVYTTVFVFEDAEPYRRIFRQSFGLTEVSRLTHIPFIFYILFQTFQWYNVISFLMYIATLFIYFMNQWLVYLTTATLSTIIYSKQTSEKADLMMLRERLADGKKIKSYQVLQLLTRILNSWAGTIWLGFHHATLLAIPVICFFVSIRWGESVSNFTLFILVLVGMLSTLIMYLETLLWSLLPEKSAKFLRIMRRRNTRKSTLGKKLRACQLIEGGLGKPFYTLSRYSFLIYMEQLLSFLSTLLLSVK